MSSLSSWLWGTSQLDDAVDKATSEMLPAGAEDIALNLEICDQIRSKSVSAKDAMRALKRRLNHKNPNVQILALGLTDLCVKNGGDLFLTEIASREFMDNLVSILKVPALNMDVKNNILKHIQNWSGAFEAKPTLGYVGQVYRTLRAEGFKFPPQDYAHVNSAMVDTQTAPEWIDSDVCMRCRTAFTFTNRKHHCRNCGQVFDQQCSSKSMPLPHFGITQDVRVCDGCHAKLLKKAEKPRDSNKHHRHHTISHPPRHRSAQDLADSELQRAIELSLQETRTGTSARPGYVPAESPAATWGQYSEPPLVDRSVQRSRVQMNDEEEDPELRAALEASLREAQAPKPSAPAALDPPQPSRVDAGSSQINRPLVVPPPSVPKLPSYDLDLSESDAILTFSQTIEQVQAQGGKDMSRYPAVNELFDKANSLRPKLALSLDDAGRKEQMLSEMHDKLSQAVQLYDKLLTEQVSHPTWRISRQQPPVATPAQAHQPANAQFPPGYQVANGYASVAAPSHQAPLPPQQAPMSLAQPSQAMYAAPPSLHVAPPPPSQSMAPLGQDPSYPYTQHAATGTTSQGQWYPAQAQQQMVQQEQPQIQHATAPQQLVSQQDQMRRQYVPPVLQSPPPPPQQQQQQQHAVQPQNLQYTGVQPPQSQPEQQVQTHFVPPPQQLQQPLTPQPQHQFSQPLLPQQIPSSPPPHAPAQIQPNIHTQYSAPRRSSSVSYATSSVQLAAPTQHHTTAPHKASQFSPSNAHEPFNALHGMGSLPSFHSPPLSRHNTLHVPPTALPSFPIVPTSAPTQAWPSVPIQQQERKEALLIDL